MLLLLLKTEISLQIDERSLHQGRILNRASVFVADVDEPLSRGGGDGFARFFEEADARRDERCDEQFHELFPLAVLEERSFQDLRNAVCDETRTRGRRHAGISFSSLLFLLLLLLLIHGMFQFDLEKFFAVVQDHSSVFLNCLLAQRNHRNKALAIVKGGVHERVAHGIDRGKILLEMIDSLDEIAEGTFLEQRSGVGGAPVQVVILVVEDGSERLLVLVAFAVLNLL